MEQESARLASSQRTRSILQALTPERGHDTSQVEEKAEADTIPALESDTDSESDSEDEASEFFRAMRKSVRKVLSSPLVASIGCHEKHVDQEARAEQPASRGRPDYFDFASDTAGDADEPTSESGRGIGMVTYTALAMIALTTPVGDDRTPMREMARRQLVAHLHGMELPDSYNEAHAYSSINAMPPAAGAESEGEESGFVHQKLHRSTGLKNVTKSSPVILKDVAVRRSDGGLGQTHTYKRIRNTLYDTGAALNVADDITVAGWEREGCHRSVKWHPPQALSLLELGVVGGGTVMAVGACTVELLFRDEDSDEWHAIEVTFVVIRSKVRTCILGTPFQHDHNTVPFVGENRVLF